MAEEIITYLVDRKFGKTSYSDGLTVVISAERTAWKQNPKWHEAVESFRKALGKKTPPELNALYQAEKAKEADEKKVAVEAEELSHFFNHPNAQADLSHWRKMDLWTLDEAISLTLGKDPKAVNWENIEPYFKVSPFADEYAGRRDLVMRAVDAGLLTERITPRDFLAWAKLKKMSYPQVLERHVAMPGGKKVGRPSTRHEILAAYIDLRDNDKDVDYDAPLNRIYPKIRKKVGESRKGFGDEAIRTAITGRFQDDKVKQKKKR